MQTRWLGVVFMGALALAGCGKKDEGGGAGGGGGGASSGLPWTPAGYDQMSAACKKTLACCEEIAKADGAKSAEDYNLKCSGPALWKENECELDLKSRIALLEGDSKPVPAACK